MNQQDLATEQLKNTVNQALDTSVDTIPQAKLQRIRRARQAALQAQYEAPTQPKIRFSSLALTPVAVAVCVGVLVHYFSSGYNDKQLDEVAMLTALPIELLDDSLATDELALVQELELVQDLEFVDWLAEQENIQTGHEDAGVVL